MGHKPEINDIDSAKMIEEFTSYKSNWVIDNTICPLCRGLCQIKFYNDTYGGEDFSIYTDIYIKCSMCSWSCNFISFNWNEEGYPKLNMIAWKMYCKIWEKLNEVYTNSFINSKIHYNVEKMMWYSNDNKEKSICPACLQDDIEIVDKEDRWLFCNIEDCAHCSVYSKGQEYQYSENNELIIDDIRSRYILEIEYYNFDEDLELKINNVMYYLDVSYLLNSVD